MPRVLIMINSLDGLFNFRRELLQTLLQEGYEIIISAPEHKKSSYFTNLGCTFINTPINRRGTNPFKDLRLLLNYLKIIKKFNPDIILTYTIKPNIYGGIAATILRKKIIHTVTGLGTVYIQDIWQKNMIIRVNKFAFKHASTVFFLNNDNKDFYIEKKIISREHRAIVVAGSGVNLEVFKYRELPISDDKIIFSFIGRILKDKGIEEYLSAANELSKLYDNLKFLVVGPVEEEKYINLLNKYEREGIIKYLGRRDNIFEIMERSCCIVLPSYGEGRGTVLQEGAAVGRPLITCDTYGCRDNVDDGYNGYLCNVADTESLIISMKKFIKLSNEKKSLMGKKSRKKAEDEFDRRSIIKAYLDEIKKILNKE